MLRCSQPRDELVTWHVIILHNERGKTSQSSLAERSLAELCDPEPSQVGTINPQHCLMGNHSFHRHIATHPTTHVTQSALYRDHTHSRQLTILLQQIFLLSLCTYMRSKHEANSRAFSVSATSTWNSLPAHIRSIDTLSTTITTTASTSSPVNLADQTREPQSNCNRNDFWCDE